MNHVLVYIGSAAIVLWGLAHVAASKSVLAGFSSASLDNRRVIAMEWIAEGLALCFVGVVAALSAAVGESTGETLVWACAGMLVVLAVLSLFTGARTSILPMRICPIVKLSVATLYVLGNLR